ncbi:ATP-binding protein [Streptomyces sp. NBC_01477]|uniref:ATP-binding protein n=1 Tax=Streptomyces sp. NBC_01477 TaxID=2976015 RepID=UPI002E30E767|nr:ATP-binding protein [Streptomyces sp. NBC_01477]
MTKEPNAIMEFTPTAPVPTPSEPICDEFAVRVSSTAATGGALERDLDGRWVGRLRRISVAKLRAWGLAALMDDVQLLVSELVTNALRYGEDGEITFRLVITLQGVLIAVNDGSSRRPRLSVVDEESETGRGLFLVAAIAHDWGVSPDGTTTWCTLRVAEPQ